MPNPAATHNAFPYFWDDDEGITWGTFEPPYAEPWRLDHDLRLYYGGMSESEKLTGWASRWDVQNYSLIVQTWLKKPDVQTLLSNTRPGATGELFTILGKPTYYDKSWTAANTIKVSPHPSSNLSFMRNESVMYPKNVTLHPIKGSAGWIDVKIEGFISGNQDI